MSEEKRLTFIERLTLKYPNKVKIAENGKEAWFEAENKDFGNVTISGDLNDWRDVNDFDDVLEEYEKIGADFADVTDDFAFIVKVENPILYSAEWLFASEAIEYLDEVFADNIILHRFKRSLHWEGTLYRRASFEKLLAQDKIRLEKKDRLYVWSGDYT